MMDQNVRDEIEQNAAWWGREFTRLVHATTPPKPFNPQEHVDHATETVRNWAAETIRTFCECGTPIPGGHPPTQ